VPYRVILGQLHGVGDGTCTEIGNRTVNANLNFRDLFYSSLPPSVFTGRQAAAITRVAAIIQAIHGWNPGDTLASRVVEMEQIGAMVFDRSSQPGIVALADWLDLVNSLPGGMTLDELYTYLDSDTEAGRFQILDSVTRRLGLTDNLPQNPTISRIRVLTMHGAKGLEGQVVFIPGIEQGIVPSAHAITAPGYVNEERRLLYTAITRSKACCVVSFVQTRIGSQAYLLSGRGVSNRVRSQFIPEIGTIVTPRISGLTQGEIASIVSDISIL
jgi:superfamily I DNA/RNA helicase